MLLDLLISLQTSYHSYDTSVRDTSGDASIFYLFFLGIIGVVVWLFVRYLMRKTKGSKVKYYLKKFSESDPFWDESKMLHAARLTYDHCHTAWAQKNAYYITGFASQSLIDKWQNIWKNLDDQGLAFHTTRAEIDSVHIVGAEDSSDNNKDNFTVEISAYVIRYVYVKATRQPIEGHYNGRNLVTDHFTFTRNNNKWILTNVEFYTGLDHSMKLRMTQEKPGKPDNV